MCISPYLSCVLKMTLFTCTWLCITSTVIHQTFFYLVYSLKLSVLLLTVFYYLWRKDKIFSMSFFFLHLRLYQKKKPCSKMKVSEWTLHLIHCLHLLGKLCKSCLLRQIALHVRIGNTQTIFNISMWVRFFLPVVALVSRVTVCSHTVRLRSCSTASACVCK